MPSNFTLMEHMTGTRWFTWTINAYIKYLETTELNLPNSLKANTLTGLNK